MWRAMLYPECLIYSHSLSISRAGKGVRHHKNNGLVALNAKVQATTMKGPRPMKSPPGNSKYKLSSMKFECFTGPASSMFTGN